MTDEHRLKIKNSNILNALIEHIEGKRDMSATQVTAGLGLLRKVMPDLGQVEHSGSIDMKPVEQLTDAQIDARLAELGRARMAASANEEAAPLDPSQLN